MEQTEFKVENGLLFCYVNCYTQALADLNIEDSLWHKTVIDLAEIATIKESAEGKDESIGSRTSLTLKSGERNLINIDFDTMAILWAINRKIFATN